MTRVELDAEQATGSTQWINLGILAHIDAGKTSLTERLLYASGAIAEVGSVDAGSTATDSMELERARGITIRSAVATFVSGDTSVNILDTPGHPDFIAEVERVLDVLDGAILVVSAVEGVQAQTTILMRALRRLKIPTLVFINKVDRTNADPQAVLTDLSARFGGGFVRMSSVSEPGTKAAQVAVREFGDRAFRSELLEELAGHDDVLLKAFVEDEASVDAARLSGSLTAQVKAGHVFPTYVGSAITGVGVDDLLEAAKERFAPRAVDQDRALRASVFKIDRGSSGEKISFVRMFSGELRVRERVDLPQGKSNKVSAIEVFAHGGTLKAQEATAGEIARVWGLSDARIGTRLGAQSRNEVGGLFAPPTLETVVTPVEGESKGAVFSALTQLAEQDPLINLRQDDIRQELSVSLYGEVQKEVIQATLHDEFGVGVEFSETKVICVEQLIGRGASREAIGDEDNPYLATVGLRVEPSEPGEGNSFGIEVELGSMPPAFFRAVEETVFTTLEQGLFGWRVTNCKVFMTDSGYLARQSHAHGTFDKNMSTTAGDFRFLTPLVLMEAIRQAGTLVLEPLHHFRLDVPEASFAAIPPVLAKLGAVPEPPILTNGTYTIEGTIPVAKVHQLQLQLPPLTRGEGVLDTHFERYEEVHGQVPSRRRLSHDPLDRRNYHLAVKR